MPSDGELLHERVARMVDALGADGVGARGYADVGAVTGLTYPEEAPALRALMPRAILLVPGLGAQGGRPEDFARLPRRGRARRGRGGVAQHRGRRGATRERRAGAARRSARAPRQAARDTNAALARGARGRGPLALVARYVVARDARRQVQPRRRLVRSLGRLRQVDARRHLDLRRRGGSPTTRAARSGAKRRTGSPAARRRCRTASRRTAPRRAPRTAWISTARFWICGWITVVLDLLVDDRPDRPT